MHTVFLLLGSNMGNRLELLRQARTWLKAQVGNLVALSACYESEPWGFEAETWFINQVVQAETMLTPEQLLLAVQHIEQQLGRVRGTNIKTNEDKPLAIHHLSCHTDTYQSRPMDIDILFYDDVVVLTPALHIPHPLLHLRLFTLLPLHDIAPHYNHPSLRQTIAELLAQCNDKGIVKKYSM
ncbi:MAG: 2-amino-4-hydroxy-6-hydroxymethyldihydropteridine diphosphokinase [Prevotellaceae bacterium]|jgi:2-amino-4-hydroxy-6-hydroxymethyldihydropteridine diphosphokinase|nr:2-amino-4-hydroxy-6-hydroxymethyldihydropteridine diphosphokinase [Prevotellaceae bacterium]